ncbi:hypothetical protein [Bacillus sp. RO1]|nr:hypothetical protein [Bacillus sp. RO1]NLP50808.1 hypothetical protein [Bacillus sp. RO1]
MQQKTESGDFEPLSGDNLWLRAKKEKYGRLPLFVKYSRAKSHTFLEIEN